MAVLATWNDLPPKVRAYLDAVEGFVCDVDGKTIATPTDGNTFIDDGVIDADDAVKAVNGLANEIRELIRTRSEAEAAARVAGYQEGQHDLRKSIASILGISP